MIRTIRWRRWGIGWLIAALLWSCVLPGLATTAHAAEAERVRIDGTNTTPNKHGRWYEENRNPEFFAFHDGYWWTDGWAWMYNNANHVGDYVDFKFDGTAVALFMKQWSYGGIVKVYVDDALEATIDTYDAAETDNVNVFERGGLDAGEHTLRVEVAGKSVSTEAFMLIQGFEYSTSGEQPEPSSVRVDPSTHPYNGGAWAGKEDYSEFAFHNGSWWSDGWSWMYNNADNAGEKVDFVFTGTSIKLYMELWDHGGKVDLYLDGELEATVDTYSAERIAEELVLDRANLALGEHTLRIEVAGKSVSTAAFVLVKAFEYGTDTGWTEPGIQALSNGKPEYALGEAFDPDSVEIAYYDGESTVTVDPGQATFSGFDSVLAGQKTVTISYLGHTARIRVNVGLPPFGDGTVNLGQSYAKAITASSTKDGYDPRNVVDGVYEGYPESADKDAEWAANGETAGAWIRIDFEYPVTVNEIRLFDRKETTEAITSGRLAFSDGTEVAVQMPELRPNPKTPAIVKLAEPKTDIEWVTFTADTHHPSAAEVGLSELQVLGPEADLAFRAVETVLETASGGDVAITIARNSEGRALSGSYDVNPPDGWTVVSGGSFAEGSESDVIVLRVPEEYYWPDNEITITARSAEGETYGYPIVVHAKLTGYAVTDKLVSVFSPDYYSEIAEDEVGVVFHAPGYTLAKATSLHAPDETNGSEYGYIKTVAARIELDADRYGRGSFTFPASEFPAGPVTIRITAWNESGESDDSYLVLRNTAGEPWDGGKGNTIGGLPSALAEHGLPMEEVFLDEFTEMPTISYTGEGEDVKYAAAKPDPDAWPEFSDAKFAPPGYSYGDAVADYSPFSIASDDYMVLETKDWGTVIEPKWGQTVTTGFLSSMGTDGTGFATEPGAAQYFEARMYLPPNAGMWPAFWTLTPKDPDGRPGFDELDIVEAYMGGTQETYTLNHHTWGDGYGGIHTGSSANTGEYGNAVNLVEGWHTYGALITEETTYYYFDDAYVEGSSHPTLDRSWTVGNYFMISPAFRHADADKYPGGFGKYGDTAETYVDWVRVYQARKEGFTPMRTHVDITPGTPATFEILRDKEASALSGRYDIEMPAGWTIESGETFGAGSAVDAVVLNVPDTFDAFEGVLTVTPIGGDGEAAGDPIEISFTTLGLYGIAVEPTLKKAGEGYRIELTYSNYSSTANADVVITADGPDGWTATKTIARVEPKSSATVAFEAPELSLYQQAEFTFRLRLSENYEVTKIRSVSGLAAAKAEAPIAIDGTIRPEDWEGAMPLVLDRKSHTSGAWAGTDDLSATGKLKWDDDYLYMYVDVRDNVHHMEQEKPTDAWGGDSLQISIDPARADGPVLSGVHMSYTASLHSTKGGSVLSVDIAGYPELGLQWGSILDDSKVAVKRDEIGKKTTYTIAMAWSEVLPEGYEDASDLGIALVINDSDGTGRKGWANYMGGIATGKDPAQFGDLILSELASFEREEEPEQPCRTCGNPDAGTGEEEEPGEQEGEGTGNGAGGHSFKDVDFKYAWAAAAISFLHERGIVKGLDEHTFGPERNAKRGDVVLMLTRALKLSAEPAGNFGDVAEGSYYYDAIAVAKALGIAAGDGDGFRPGEAITRQDLMVLIDRALAAAGYPLAAADLSVLDDFADREEVAGYASDSVAKLVAAGLVKGNGIGLNPQGYATRAEIAVLIHRILAPGK